MEEFLTTEDKQLLEELCEQYNFSFDKVEKLLTTVRKHEFRGRRRGIYDELREIIRSEHKNESQNTK